MQKNKIDVVKAVCSSAVRKLAVLGLAVAVSAGSSVSAQTSGGETEKQLSEMSSLERLIETNGDEVKRQRLNALNNNIEEILALRNTLKQQFNETEQRLKEKNQQLKENNRQLEQMERRAERRPNLTSMHDCLVIDNFLLSESNDVEEEGKTFLNEKLTLLKELNTLLKELNTLQNKLNTLLQQRNALRAELAGEIPEPQRDQAELMDLAVAEASRQNIPVREFAPRFFANIGLPQEAIRNIMRLFGHGQQQNQQQQNQQQQNQQQQNQQQQNQQQQYPGGKFNPLNWIFSGGSSN